MKKQKCMLIKQSTNVVGEMRLRSLIDTIRTELHVLKDTRSYSEQQLQAIERMIDRTPKKCIYQSNAQDLTKAAFNDFLRVNEDCGGITLSLSPDEISYARDFIVRALEKFTHRMTGDHQVDLDMGVLLELWGYGPGASSATKATHFAEKIQLLSPSCTQRAQPFAALLRRLNPHLWTFDCSKRLPFTKVRGSTLSAVPKNEDAYRTICTEPLMNMSLQLAAGKYVEGALRTIGLDIRKQQQVNKLLAEFGSASMALATIDLKSASDLISLALIKALWPQSWFHLFSAVRSEECCVDGEWVKLNMLSTMGNGFTFPVMTLTLLALVYVVQSKRVLKPYYVDFRTTAVYGDDIIVPVEDYSGVFDILTRAGLVVNPTKSYSTGSFRESCGGDYFMGYNITPFYVKSLLNDAEVYVAINQLLEWQCNHDIRLYKSFAYLVNLLHNPKLPFFVPVWADAFAGIRTTLVPERYDELKVVNKEVSVPTSEIHYSVLVLMITGGYVIPGKGDTVCFVPRSKDTRYTVSKARLPKGRLDGQSSVIRSHERSQVIDRFLTIATLREEVEGRDVTRKRASLA